MIPWCLQSLFNGLAKYICMCEAWHAAVRGNSQIVEQNWVTEQQQKYIHIYEDRHTEIEINVAKC